MTARGPIHEDLQQWIEAYCERVGCSWQQLERGELWGKKLRKSPRGAVLEIPFANREELVQYLVFSDPVHFAECALVELEQDGQPPWRLWDYQKASLRYQGNTLHQCGAEVGKTREIVILHLWDALVHRGNSLIGAALDGHLDLIWQEILGQCQANPWLHAQVDWEQTRVKPYKTLAFANGNKIFFRPAGLDGSAFRGVHVRRRASMDEATKVKNPEAWGNFFSRCKPGCEIRIYSTPDGDRTSTYYELCSRTQEVDPLHPGRAASGGERQFAKFRWPKDRQPAPYWTPEREAAYLEQYGGRDSSAYQQNVYGNWGDPAATVFPWNWLARCLRYNPDTIIVQLLADEGQGTLYAEAHRLNAGYEVRKAVGDEGEEVGAAPLSRCWHEELPLRDLEATEKRERVARWVALLRPLVGHLEGRNLVGGVDYGSTSDPTEILLGEPVGRRTDIVGRIQLKRFEYEAQEEVLRALDEILHPSHGWGGDSTGVGTAVEHHLRRPLDGRELSYSGFVFNATTADIDPTTGTAALDPDTGRERRVTWKELATRLLEIAVQQQRFLLPYDPAVLLEWSSHTARLLPSGRRQFAGGNDHTIDAARCLMLRLYQLEVGVGAIPPLDLVGTIPHKLNRTLTALADYFEGGAPWRGM